MPFCAVSCCKNKSNTSSLKKDNITFHQFPKEPIQRQIWTKACNNLPAWKPTRTSCICSKHFLQSCFNEAYKRRILLPNAVPTLCLTNETEVSKLAHMSTTSPLPTKNQILLTPRKMKLLRRVKEKDLKIKRLTYQNKTLKKKVTHLKEILETLSNRDLIDKECSLTLEHIGVENKELFSRQVLKVKTGKVPKSRYSNELKCFALTLNYYSPKAYTYVRKVYSTCLPAPRTLRRWYSTIDGKPGFTKEALRTLKLRKEAAKEKKIFCTLVIDEMKIKTFTEWDRNTQKNFGYVNYGFDFVSDCSEKATEALVFLLVAINSTWKVPVAYFLVNKMTAKRTAWLVTQAIQLIDDTGVEIKALTCDGTKVNLAMAGELGCCLDENNLQTSFLDPTTGHEIAFFLDPCHMLKLVRNALEAYGIFILPNGELISWEHIENLHKLQEEELFFLANKLRANHVYFKSKIMNVRLAAQLFSHSVGDAILFCRDVLKYEKFKDAVATVEFLKLINDLFDILDSRTRQYGYKRALNAENYDVAATRLDQAKNTLMNLSVEIKNKAGVVKNVKLLKSPRFTGFLGFCVCIESTKTLYRNLVLDPTSGMTYLPLHKISQDHVEFFFLNVRSHGGSNDNPTARQFEAIKKKILVHTDLIDFGTGNCSALEKISILNCSSPVDKINTTSSRGKCYDKDEVIDSDDIDLLNALEDVENYIYLSPFGEKVIEYISGFVVHSLIKKIKCDTCVSALLGEIDKDSITFYKNKGRLIYPSQDVIRICRQSEIELRRNLEGRILKAQCTTEHIITKTLSKFIGVNLFEDFNFHMYHDDTVNHIIELTKIVMKIYIDTRIAFLRKESDPKKCVRQIYKKLIQAKGQ